MANSNAQERAHGDVEAITVTARSATTVDEAQKTADKFVNETRLHYENSLSSTNQNTKSEYINQLNKDLEERKILPALSLAYVTDDQRWADVSKSDGFIDKEHIEQYKREKNISDTSVEGLYLNKAEQLIGNNKVNRTQLANAILDQEKIISNLGTQEATSAAQLLVKGGESDTVLDKIDHGGNGYTSDRRISKEEIDKFLRSKEASQLSKEEQDTLSNLYKNWNTPQVKALLNDQGYLSLNDDDRTANKNTLHKYLNSQQNESNNSTGNSQPNRPADANAAASSARPADAGATKPAEAPKLYDTLPAIAARNDLPPGEQEDLKKLSAAGYKLDPNDHGDKANPHTEVYKGPNGEVIAIDRDSNGNAVGYTEGNTNTKVYWAYKKYADADPNTPGQTAKWAFYEGSQPKWTTGGVTMDSTGKVRAKDQRLAVPGQADPNNVGDY